MTKQATEPLVMTANVRAVTATEEFDLVHGQTLDADTIERLGPGKVNSLTQTKQAISKSEFDKLAHPLSPFVDTPADKATVESLGRDPKGASRKIDDRPLPPDHPLAGRKPAPQKTAGRPTVAPPAWRTTPIEKLEVEPRVRTALAKPGLKTVGDVLEHGNTHQGLTSIEGITAADEQAVQAAISKLADAK